MSLSDKFTELGSKLVILSNRIKYLASQPRLNASQSDNTEKLEGKSKTQVNAVLASKTIAHASQITNPHDVTAEQIGIPTKAQVDAQISTLIPSGILPFSNLGTQDYLPLGVAGSFEGASSNPTRQSIGMILEQDGTLVVLRNGTNGSTTGVLYAYLTNAELGPFRPPTRTNKTYTPTYFPSGVRAKALLHASEVILIGELEDVYTGAAAGYFVSLTNGTYDDRLHTGIVLTASEWSASLLATIDDKTVSLMVGDLIYFVKAHDGGRYSWYGVYLYTLDPDDVIAGSLNPLKAVTGITIDGIVGTEVDREALVFAPLISSTVAGEALIHATGEFRSLNLQHSGQYVVYAQMSDEGLLRVTLSHSGYAASAFTSNSFEAVTSCVYNPVTKHAVVDPIPGPPAIMTMSEDQRRITRSGGFWNGTARHNLSLRNQRNAATVQHLLTTNGFMLSYANTDVIDLISFSRYFHADFVSKFDYIRRVEYDRRAVGGTYSTTDDPQFPTALGSLLSGAIYLGNDRILLYAEGRDEREVIRPGLVLTKLEGSHDDYTYRRAFAAGESYNGYPPSSMRKHITDPSVGVVNEKDWHYPVCEVIGQDTYVSGRVFAGSLQTPTSRPKNLHSDLSVSGESLNVADSVLLAACDKVATGVADVVGENVSRYGMLIYPQHVDVPPFMYVLVNNASTRTTYMVFAQVDDLVAVNGNLTDIVIGQIYPPRVTGTNTTSISWSITSYPGSRGAWCFYDTDDAVLIGGYIPLNRSYIGSSNRASVRFKFKKSTGKFIDPTIIRGGNQLPTYDISYFVHPEHGFCQANGGTYSNSVSDYLTKCLMIPIAKTEAEFDAYKIPDKENWIVLASQDVAEGWSVYFTDQTPLFMIGNSYTLQPTDFDLRDIDPNPQSKTFFVYVTVVNDQPQYLIQTTESEETFTTMFIGTITTGLTQIESINIDKVYRIDTVRISTTPVGSAIPTSTGHPADTERLSWT